VFRFVFSGFLVVAAASCSGGARDAGPNGRRDPVASARPDWGGGTNDPGRAPRPLDAALVARLAAVTVAGSDVTVVRRSDAEMASIVATPDGVRVTVTASACLGCTPIDLAAWEARRAELAALWAPVDTAGDKLALSAEKVAGRTVIAIDAMRTVDGEQRHTYQLHWNDGATQLAAVCEAATCAATTAASMAAYLGALTN
jgi:hypothetical protein